MTFFFSTVYLQYHINRIARWKKNGSAQIVMTSPRTRRLILDEKTLQTLLQSWPLIQITGKAGIPPEICWFTYNLRGLYISGSGEILERDSHVLEVNLSSGIPGGRRNAGCLRRFFIPTSMIQWFASAISGLHPRDSMI